MVSASPAIRACCSLCWRGVGGALLWAAALSLSCGVAPRPLEWPATRAETRPWAYWWWMGSAVTREDLTQALEAYRAAGLGGVHVIPIYGVRGQEDRFIPFLSEEWVEMLAHTVSEGERLGLGVDATAGTGWPFGGPHVAVPDSASRLALESYRLAAGERLRRPITHRGQERPARLAALVAYSDDGAIEDLTARVDERGQLDWTPSRGAWRLYALFDDRFGQTVERAAPGGEGYVLDFFSEPAVDRYLARFDEAYDRHPGLAVRAFYNDSFEVPDASWTSAFFHEFEERRGYDLRWHFPALAGEADEDETARVKADFRETISDLLLERFVRPWVDWAHRRGSLARNQAHGMPGHLLDLYAAADIPETEQFGPTGLPIPGLRRDPDFSEEQFGRPDKLIYKLASSAAHVVGRRLVSSESATWLGEHFQVSLAQVKPELDQLFLGGINHVFFHGIPFSPPEEPWPGRLFYASTHFGPTNSFWRDLPALNEYVTRVQSFLQSGDPDADLLLYFPIHDLWHDPEGLQASLSVHNPERWLYGRPFYRVARELDTAGYAVDYISDRQVQELEWTDDRLEAPGGGYRAILLPPTRLIPVPTLERLIALSEQGAVVLVVGGLPSDVPGLGALAGRRERLEELRGRLVLVDTPDEGLRRASLERGRWLVGPDALRLAETVGVPREPMVEAGLQFVRRATTDGRSYFVANLGAAAVDGWIPLSGHPESVALFDPLSGRAGVGALRQNERNVEIHIQLRAGESILLQTRHEGRLEGDLWHGLDPSDEQAQTLTGEWTVSFLEGGPALPEERSVSELVSWTRSGGADTECFSGTARYSIDFEVARPAEAWVLDLGRVAESARVRLDGETLGTVFAIPFRIAVDAERLTPGRHRLEVEVTNLMANRIRCLDRQGVEWRRFYDINFVTVRYRRFDASGWEPLESGLLGPVRLIPARRLRVRAASGPQLAPDLLGDLPEPSDTGRLGLPQPVDGRVARPRVVEDQGLGVHELLTGQRNFGQEVTGHGGHAVGIGVDDVAGPDRDAAHGDRHVHLDGAAVAVGGDRR